MIMKNLWIPLLILILCFSSCKKGVKTEIETTKAADSVKTEDSIAEKPLDSAAQMKAWMDYATPGSEHKMMADETGTWNCAMTFWQEEGGKPEKATSTAVIKMILGGRYQEANYQGAMMGQPFEGKSTVGYDNARKIFQSTWVDNMGTGIMYTEGKYNPQTKSITLTGNTVDPGSGKMEKVREIFKFVDEKTQMMEMFMT